MGGAANLKDKPIFSEDVPESERLSRDKLIDLADGYFSTIQQNTGKIYTSFDPTIASASRTEESLRTIRTALASPRWDARLS